MKLYIYKIFFALLAIILIVSCGVQNKLTDIQQQEQAETLVSSETTDQTVVSNDSSSTLNNIVETTTETIGEIADEVKENGVTEEVKEKADSTIHTIEETVSSVENEDSVALSLLDSLKAKYSDNGTGIQWNDSVAAAEDSIKQHQKKNILEAPVVYTAKDSVIFIMTTKNAYLYGDGNVKYQNIELASEQIVMNMDSSIVHAVGVKDSLGVLKGTPIFKQGSDEYKSETMAYNFKSKKGYITNVYTEQQDGFLRSKEAKKSGDDELYIRHGKYTTCDEEHPHFYIDLSRAKVHTGKNIFAGPAWLVVEDVPLPLAVPFAYFPFTQSYSSGFIMPSYGDESSRGFYLRDGGYYFAFSDYFDLKLTGEIFTKGSWGVNAQTNYKKRYKYNGNLYISYLVTVNGEKNLPDYSATKNFKITWNHNQDAKAANNSTFHANIDFSTSSYEKNNLTSLYDPSQYSQSQRRSSVGYNKSFPKIGLSITSSFNITQNVKDSTLDVTLPELSISLSRLYPFKRKKAAGKERWYEKIGFSYTGALSNSIHTKENLLFKSNLARDWKNGVKHSIPISATFNLLKYINVTPSFNYTARWYFTKEMQNWDYESQKVVKETKEGFYHVQDFNLSLSANTKIYGFFTPSKKIFGDKIQKIRHVITPNVTYSYAPDFSSGIWGYYEQYTKTDAEGNTTTEYYSPFSQGMYGVPGKGKTGTITVDLDNNIEMKYKDKNDSIKKIPIIDQLGASLGYNFAAIEKPWSNLNAHIRLKYGKWIDLRINAVFDTYAYEFDKNGNVIVGNTTEWSHGRFGRFQSYSKNFTYTFNNQSWKKIKNGIAKLFGGKVDEDVTDKDKKDNEDTEEDAEINNDPTDFDKKKSDKKGEKDNKEGGTLDADGYLAFKIPWSFSISYGITMAEDRSATINIKSMRYPYKFTHNLNFSGNLKISSGWSFNFTSGWDFTNNKISHTNITFSRDMHCFNISGSLNLGPFTSYNVTLRANASTLTDALKYDKKSSYSSSVKWY